jgi:cytoskeletal protein CcmA (bactofilin family)
MSVFGKKEETAINPKSMNHLGPGTLITGDLKSESDIRIDGKIEGNVHTKSKLVVGSNAVIEGNVFCANGVIEGTINGNVEAGDLLILTKTAFISGDILIKKLVVEEGAKFNGRCSMGIQIVRNTANEETKSVRPIKQA